MLKIREAKVRLKIIPANGKSNFYESKISRFPTILYICKLTRMNSMSVSGLIKYRVRGGLSLLEFKI